MEKAIEFIGKLLLTNGLTNTNQRINMTNDQSTPNYSFHKDQATPRPWQRSRDGRVIESVHTVPCIDAIDGGEGKMHQHICMIGNVKQFPDKEANARLIVKAVNCHDELISALKKSEIALLSANNSGVLSLDEARVIKIIEQALSKAEGK